MQPAPNTKYWFVLGREPLIAAAEIDAVFLPHGGPPMGGKFQYFPPILKINAPIDAKALMRRVGGTIKIAEEMADSAAEKDLKKIIVKELKNVEGKINFGLSFYAPEKTDLKEIKNLGLEIKKDLKKEGYSVRYVENKEAALSSVTVEKNGLTKRGREFLIQENKYGDFSIAKTKAVQPFEEFGARDFGRPGRDDFSGMLPPKLAMTLVNLAQISPNAVLLDPFCGSGTILSEAMLLGYKNLIGSDISEKAIHDSKINIEWIADKFNKKMSFQSPLVIPTTKEESLSGSVGQRSLVGASLTRDDKIKIEIFKNEVEKLSARLHANSIDAVVTEPYLGKPLRGHETKTELANQVKQLKNLYLLAFRQFFQILKPGGKIIFIIPSFRTANDWITVDCKNEIEKIGFKTMPFFENKMPLFYARPNQRVAREIWRFIKR